MAVTRFCSEQVLLRQPGPNWMLKRTSGVMVSKTTKKEADRQTAAYSRRTLHPLKAPLPVWCSANQTPGWMFDRKALEMSKDATLVLLHQERHSSAFRKWKVLRFLQIRHRLVTGWKTNCFIQVSLYGVAVILQDFFKFYIKNKSQFQMYWTCQSLWGFKNINK